MTDESSNVSVPRKQSDEILYQDDPRFRITPTQQMAAACTGALATSLIMTPMDVVKIRLQAQQKQLTSNKCFLYCNGLMDHVCPCLNGNGNTNGTTMYWYRRPSHFTGTADAFVKIARNEGIQSLWSGLSPTLVLAVPATVVYFVSYEQLRTRLCDRFTSPGSSQPFWVPLTSGCTARLWAATVVSPLELIRTKMQSKKLSYLEVNQAIQSLLQYHGWRGLWKGLTPTLLRDVPFSGIYWVSYESIKSLNPQKNVSFTYSFVAGSLAGALASFLTTPFDVVKTFRQIELAEEIFTEPPSARSNSTFSILHSIYTKSGVSGLFAGLTPRIIKVAPACAIMVSTFEYGKNFFEVFNMVEYEKMRAL